MHEKSTIDQVKRRDYLKYKDFREGIKIRYDLSTLQRPSTDFLNMTWTCNENVTHYYEKDMQRLINAKSVFFLNLMLLEKSTFPNL